jgi:hypothetical protein
MEGTIQEHHTIAQLEGWGPKILSQEALAESRVIEFCEMQQAGLAGANELQARAGSPAGIQWNPTGQQSRHGNCRPGPQGEMNSQGTVLVPILRMVWMTRRVDRCKLLSDPTLFHVASPLTADRVREQSVQPCGV